MELEVGRQPNLRDDPMGDCRSLGSNCHPSSQSRKISIGVMVESLGNERSRGSKELKSTVPDAEVVFSSLARQRNGKEKDTTAVGTTVKSKLLEAPQQLSSPWVSTRSLKQKAPLMETVSAAEQVFHSPTSNGRHNKGHGLKKASATYSVRLFADQSSAFKSGNSKEENFNKANYQMEGRRDGTSEQLHEFSFATMAEVRSDIAVNGDQTNRSGNRTETLKMKLFEILGTASVPNDQHTKCQNHEQNANHLVTEEVYVQKDERAVRFRQNSDTIETDSESPRQALKRPVLRSLIQKRSRISVQTRKSKTPSCNKGKHEEENIFVFEGWSEGTHAVTNGGSSMCTRKKRGKRSIKFQPRKTSFPQKEDGMGTFPAPTEIEEVASGDRPSSVREVQGFHSSPANHAMNEKDDQNELYQFPHIANSQLPEYIHGSADYDQQGDIDNPFLKKNVDPQSQTESPTFRIKTPVCSSPTSTPKADDKIVDESPCPGSVEEMFSTRNICSFRKFRTPEEDYGKSNVKPNFSEDDQEIEKSPPRKAASGSTKVAEDRLTNSSSEDASYESSAEGSSQRDSLSPEIGAVKKFQAMLRPVKRARNLENLEFDFNNTSTKETSRQTYKLSEWARPGESKQTYKLAGAGPGKSRQTYKRAGPAESSWAEEILVSNEEDALARAVKLFLSELEKLRSKISSTSIEKSSEILLSAADSIHSQLQSVESQIQMDMVKLLSLGKTREKVLETKFEEQQQQLKHINKKFKEEVNRHLQDCRNSLQELEAQQIELKGTMEKQKASHRNNLLQVEEAVDMQLADSQRKIEAIHKSGRGKLLQLKQLIAMCLK